MKDVLTFNTISQYFQHFRVDLPQDIAFTIHSLNILDHNNLTPLSAFRTNYFTFVLLKNGKGSYTIDNHWFDLKEHAFYFTTPGHLKSFVVEKSWQGYILTFSESFLRTYYPGRLESEFPFLIEESVPVMNLPKDFFAEMSDIFHLIHQDYHRSSLFKPQILCSQLATILYKTKVYLRTYQARAGASGRPAELVSQFKAVLNRRYLDTVESPGASLWTVKELADHLSVHPSYLSTVVKQKTGRPVKKWIDEKLVGEAQSLLLQSGYSVAEIAYALGFSDASSFSRFFKRATGTSPSQFRVS